MNYYIQGNKEKADKIKAAFEKLGINVLGFGFADKAVVYCSIGECVQYLPYSINLMNILYSHPDYKELELAVKSKFKIGDWIACDADSFTLSIKSVRDVNYYFHQGESLPIKYIDEHYHLWSIADAKEGDVLAINWHEDNDSWEKIIIFKNYHAKGVKGLIKQPCVEGYGNTFKNGKLAFREEVPYYSRTWTDNLQPATKEQRNLLFQKMKENGCEWDADKKDLKKIQPHYDIKNFHAGMPVLVRNMDGEQWTYTEYSHYDSIRGYKFMTSACQLFVQCIPYNDDTKHLLGTTDKPDEMYINW